MPHVTDRTRSRLKTAIATGLTLEVGLAIVFCQLSSLPIFSNIADVTFHAMVFALPFAASALCLPLPIHLACAAVIGFVLSFRASRIPLDIYEEYYSVPEFSVAFVLLVAALIWCAVNGAKRIVGRGAWEQRPWQWRGAALMVALLAASFLASSLWDVQLSLIYSSYGFDEDASLLLMDIGSPDFWAEALFDWVIWSAAALGTDLFLVHLETGRAPQDMRSVLGRWLALVVMVAFLLTTTVSYCFTTSRALREAERSMESHISYLLKQTLTHLKNGEPLEDLTDAYTSDSNGFAYVFVDEECVSTNNTVREDITYENTLGMEPEDIEMVEAATEAGLLFDQDMTTLSVRYFMIGHEDDVTVYVDKDAHDVFAHRSNTIVLNVGCYIVLFASIFVAVSRLIDRLFVRGIHSTNDVLAQITAGDLDRRVEESSTDEFRALSEGINTTVSSLKDTIAEVSRRMETELETARAIQRGALPNEFPAYPDIESFDLFASMDAAREVGGDFYGFFTLDESTLAFLIADVSGKGIPGALFMMAAKTQVERFIRSGIPLSEAIGRANAALCRGNDAGMFVTLWAATLNFATGELTYVNAGHNPPLLRHDGTWSWLKKRGGLFLGTFETAKYRASTIMLEPGDELLLYTDGVNEAFSVDDKEYGNDRLEAFLATHNDLAPRELVESLREDVRLWAEGAEQSDDITMLSLAYLGQGQQHQG